MHKLSRGARDKLFRTTNAGHPANEDVQHKICHKIVICSDKPDVPLVNVFTQIGFLRRTLVCASAQARRPLLIASIGSSRALW